MATQQQVPTDPPAFSASNEADHEDRMLDGAIEDSFPSSDPVSLAMPHNRAEQRGTRGVQITPAVRDAWPLLVIGGIIVALLLARRR